MFVARNVIVTRTDGAMMEGIVNGIPSLIGWIGARVRQLQNGLMQYYAHAMALGLFIILAIAVIMKVSG
jgi:hypothetical protein